MRSTRTVHVVSAHAGAIRPGMIELLPTVTGRAWITGTHRLSLDPTDPWPEGYRVGDTWPGA